MKDLHTETKKIYNNILRETKHITDEKERLKEAYNIKITKYKKYNDGAILDYYFNCFYLYTPETPTRRSLFYTINEMAYSIAINKILLEEQKTEEV